jgi:hypothetical protein
MNLLAFGLLELASLSRHEEVVPEHLAALTAEIERDGELREPVIVDRRTLVILDGHHRVEAMRALGCALVPAYLVDYDDASIAVLPWRAGIVVTKETVVRTGLSGNPYPPKTSRHVLPGGLPPRPTPLGRLRD